MKIDFDKLSETQKIVAIHAFIAAGSPENGCDFELKVNGVVVDFLKFVNSFVDGYDRSTRMEAVKLIEGSVKLKRLQVSRLDQRPVKEFVERVVKVKGSSPAWEALNQARSSRDCCRCEGYRRR